MTTVDEVYNYIKVGDIDKVKEYLLTLPDIVNTENLRIIETLFYCALDWKQTNIVVLLVEHWRANPEWPYPQFTVFYTSWNTNKLPELSLSEYIYKGITPEEDAELQKKRNKNC